MIKWKFWEKDEPIEDDEPFDEDSYVPEGSNSLEANLRMVEQELSNSPGIIDLIGGAGDITDIFSE